MEPDQPQSYLSYRSQADAFSVEFAGGPLDGAKILTDVFPHTDFFVHRLRERSYTYRYRQMGPTSFVAELHSFGEPTREEPSRTGWSRMIVALLMSSCVRFAATLKRLCQTLISRRG